ncbi:hypothetical protein HDU93_007206 [Gonapodya sp. JEL0774]|nr:hypothetical protein HDU93_007206 [Gonapodya sp. JEL0774]
MVVPDASLPVTDVVESSTVDEAMEDIELSDLVYYARCGQLSDLAASLSALLARPHLLPAEIYASNPTPRSLLLIPSDDYSRMTPLHAAAANGHTDIAAWIIATLSTDTIPLSSVNPTDTPQPLPTPLIDPTTTSGSTPLHWAALNGHKDIVELLCAAGANTEAKNGAGKIPVEEAETAGRFECAEVLWRWTLKREKERGGGTADDDGAGDENGGAVEGEEQREGLENGCGSDSVQATPAADIVNDSSTGNEIDTVTDRKGKGKETSTITTEANIGLDGVEERVGR